MTDLWWVTPLLALVGGILGGSIASWVSGQIAERREDRRLLREARVALERWKATSHGPLVQGYPGLDPDQVRHVQERSTAQFFERHFEATLEAKAALGAVRRYDPRIAEVLDEETWKLPAERIDELRDALSAAEKSTRKLL
jgi:hypothetical protein